jgi:hypothetical protein
LQSSIAAAFKWNNRFLVNHSNDDTVCANVSLVLALSQAVEGHPLLEERLGRIEKLSGNRQDLQVGLKV